MPAREGIGNFGKVNEKLYRGAQPDAAALDTLERLGVKLIINLREKDSWKEEAAAALSHGIVCTNIPFRGVGRPADDRVATVLSLIDAASGPVFVHCEYGCDRTGTIIACYRIKHDKWSSALALNEARQYGMSWLERGMKKYVVQFEKELGSRKADAAGQPKQ